VTTRQVVVVCIQCVGWIELVVHPSYQNIRAQTNSRIFGLYSLAYSVVEIDS